jgi:hypothetical protein
MMTHSREEEGMHTLKAHPITSASASDMDVEVPRDQPTAA